MEGSSTVGGVSDERAVMRVAPPILSTGNTDSDLRFAAVVTFMVLGLLMAG